MKTIRTIAFTPILAITAILAVANQSDAQLKIDCESVAERVKTAIEGKPNQVLTIVEDALVAYSGCVDTIVITAIETSKADADLVKQIVLVAVTTAEDEAPQIAEAAVAAAPDHADSVREAFAEAFEKKTAEAGKVATTSEKLEQVEKEQEQRTAVSSTATTQAKSALTESANLGSESIPTEAPPLKKMQSSQSQPYETNDGKAVIGEVSGKSIVADDGKSVIYEDGKNYLYDGKSVVYEPGIGGYAPPETQGFSYGPVDFAGVYLIPPVASARPMIEEPIRENRVTIVRRFIPRNRTIIRSVPMSPTSP